MGYLSITTILAQRSLNSEKASESSLKMFVKAGPTLSNITEGDYKYAPGFLVGIGLNYSFIPDMDLSAEIDYSRMGYIHAQDGLQVNFWNDYLQLPVGVRVRLWQNLKLFAGCQAAYLMQAQAVTEINGTSVSESVSSGVASWEVSIPMAVSYEWNSGFMLEFRYHAGLTHVLRTTSSDSWGKNYSFGLILGWAF